MIPRRLFQYRLKTLLLLVMLCAVGLGLLRWAVLWGVFGVGPVWSQERWPAELKALVSASPPEDQSQVKVYCLGRFIDAEYLWRMRASSDQVALMIARCSLSPVKTADVPDRFWHMPPWWWNPEPGNACFFVSPAFVADGRGADGDHCFVMYDKTHQLLYVWYKCNF